MVCAGQIYQRTGQCRYCHATLHRHGPKMPWMDVVQTLDGDNPECPKAPNQDEGPNPGHVPATPLVRNPDWCSACDPASSAIRHTCGLAVLQAMMPLGGQHR